MTISRCFSLLSPLLSLLVLLTIVRATDNKPANNLVDKICKQTSGYSFCVTSLYSDSRTPEADQYTLAFISVGLAYIHANTSQHHISELLSNGSSHDHADQQRLQRCSRDYSNAVSALAMAYNDLNSETFFELADLAGEAARSASDCQAAFKGIPSPPLANRNHDLMGLCEICVAVAKLFTGLLF